MKYPELSGQTKFEDPELSEQTDVCRVQTVLILGLVRVNGIKLVNLRIS